MLLGVLVLTIMLGSLMVSAMKTISHTVNVFVNTCPMQVQQIANIVNQLWHWSRCRGIDGVILIENKVLKSKQFYRITFTTT